MKSNISILKKEEFKNCCELKDISCGTFFEKYNSKDLWIKIKNISYEYCLCFNISQKERHELYKFNKIYKINDIKIEYKSIQQFNKG